MLKHFTTGHLYFLFCKYSAQVQRTLSFQGVETVIFSMPGDCCALTHTESCLWAENIRSYTAVYTPILLSEIKLMLKILSFHMKFLIADVFSIL